MVFENIEQLKREYTDKYVIVDNTQPELQRFEGQTGIVRTVNMNGNALVEFDANLNIGWYDIALDYLKVIDQPLPKPEPAKAAPKKSAAKKETKPAGKPAGGGGMSVAEMLAAARGEKGGAAASAPKPKKEPVEKDPPKAGKAGGGKMSVAEMLAAARAEKSGSAPAPVAEPAAEPEPAAESAAETPAAEASTPTGDLPKDVAGILAYCRKADG